MNHWQHRQLGEVCHVVMGQAPSGESYNDIRQGHPLIAGAGDFDGVLPSPKRFTTEATKLSETGDIVLAIRATIGEKVWSNGTYCLGRGVAALRPKPTLERSFLWHWLDIVRDELNHRARGATFKQVTKHDVATLIIRLPPLPEQRRIAGLLDKANELRAMRREVLDQMNGLTQAMFLEMFGDPAMNPRHLPMVSLKDLFIFRTGKLDSNAAVANGSYPFFTCSREDLRIDHYAFDCEALLLAGNNANADYSVKHYRGRFNAYQRTYVITLRDASYSYEFARFALEYQLAEMKRRSKGTGTKYLTLEILNRMLIPVPPVEAQQEFSARLAAAGRVQVLHRSSMNLLEGLFSGLQSRAFAGEL